jgi:hypothetical protein
MTEIECGRNREDEQTRGQDVLELISTARRVWSCAKNLQTEPWMLARVLACQQRGGQGWRKRGGQVHGTTVRTFTGESAN